MPIYEYQCRGCGGVIEVMQKRTDPPPAKHEACGGTDLFRVMSASAFILKGDGWYVTDYARKGKKDSGSEAKSESTTTTPAKSDKKSEGASAA